MKKWNEISPFTGSSIGEDAPTNAAGTGKRNVDNPLLMDVLKHIVNIVKD